MHLHHGLHAEYLCEVMVGELVNGQRDEERICQTAIEIMWNYRLSHTDMYYIYYKYIRRVWRLHNRLDSMTLSFSLSIINVYEHILQYT